MKNLFVMKKICMALIIISAVLNIGYLFTDMLKYPSSLGFVLAIIVNFIDTVTSPKEPFNKLRKQDVIMYFIGLAWLISFLLTIFLK